MGAGTHTVTGEFFVERNSDLCGNMLRSVESEGAPTHDTQAVIPISAGMTALSPK
jgi:hypothetical protein